MAKVFMGMSLTKRIEGELYHIWSAYTALYQADRDADFVRAHLRGVKSVRVLPIHQGGSWPVPTVGVSW